MRGIEKDGVTGRFGGLLLTLTVALLPASDLMAGNFLEDLAEKAKQEMKRSLDQARAGASGSAASSSSGKIRASSIDFTVQGISTGMNRDLVLQTLKRAGWKTSDSLGRSWSMDTPDKRKRLYLEFGVVDGEQQLGSMKYVISFNSPKLSADNLYRQVMKKYGKPHSTIYGGLSYWQYPDAPERKELVKLCMEEMTARKMPAFQARGKAQLVGNAVQMWVNNDYRGVAENCPGIFDTWKRYLLKSLGKQMHIAAVNPRPGKMGEVTISLREERVLKNHVRQVILQRQEAARNAKDAALDDQDL